MTNRILLFLALGGPFLSATVHAETYTYPQLVERMTDLQGLANYSFVLEKRGHVNWNRRDKLIQLSENCLDSVWLINVSPF